MLLFVQRKTGTFLLERKAMNNHKERWNTFSTYSEWNFLLLGVGMAWHSSVSDSVIQTLNSTWLRERDDLSPYAATLHLGRSMGGFPLFLLAVLPLPHFTKRKRNEIHRSRGGMKSLKLMESQHQRVSLHPLQIRFIILVAMTTQCNSVLPWQSDTTFKKQ